MSTLNEIAREIFLLPPEALKRPYEVPHERWLAAYRELLPRRKDEGMPVFADDIGRQNFLLGGVAVVSAYDRERLAK